MLTVRLFARASPTESSDRVGLARLHTRESEATQSAYVVAPLMSLS